MSETATGHADRDQKMIAQIIDQLSVNERYAESLEKGAALFRAGAVQSDPQGGYTIASSKGDGSYYTVSRQTGCDCPQGKHKPYQACKHLVACEIDRRYRQFTTPAKPAEPIRPRIETDRRIRADSLTRFAVESTPEPFRHYIMMIPNRINIGNRQRPEWITVHQPYMTVDGRVALAQSEGRLEIITEFQSIGEHLICNAQVTTARGFATGHERVVFGDTGVAATNPMENAETGAVGRALGFLGYGIFGTGIASADEVESAIERREESAADPEPATPAEQFAMHIAKAEEIIDEATRRVEGDRRKFTAKERDLASALKQWQSVNVSLLQAEELQGYLDMMEDIIA